MKKKPEVVPESPWKVLSTERMDGCDVVTACLCQMDGSVLYRTVVTGGDSIQVSMCIAARPSGGLVKESERCR